MLIFMQGRSDANERFDATTINHISNLFYHLRIAQSGLHHVRKDYTLPFFLMLIVEKLNTYL